MKLLKTEKEINEIIHTSNISVIYFTGRDCGACEAIKFKVEEILKSFPRVKSGEIDGEKHPDICAEFNVFSLPLLILYVDEKEYKNWKKYRSFISRKKYREILQYDL
ncbi:thioredoxin family protein [Clostridium butyricum]